MLEAILAFVRLVLATLTPLGAGDGTGGPQPPSLPAVVAERAAAVAAVIESGRPEAIPPGQGVDEPDAGAPTSGDVPPVADPPADAPPVDVSNAPESVDLSGVPAAVETAGPPAEVELPAQAGGEGAGPPADVPAGPPAEVPAGNGNDTAACAANSGGADAAECDHP